MPSTDSAFRSSPTAPTRAPVPGSPPDSNGHLSGALTLTQHTVNRALAAARPPVERGMARLKSWQMFRRARASPKRMTVTAKAVVTLERQR
ncbi:transposase family protein [Streptomyces zhihengii]|uniref:transposase family protein n=1 Tax=Streptomyces zhihengii TaxID=1818004 RepID=UPI0034525B24